MPVWKWFDLNSPKLPERSKGIFTGEANVISRFSVGWDHPNELTPTDNNPIKSFFVHLVENSFLLKDLCFFSFIQM